LFMPVRRGESSGEWSVNVSVVRGCLRGDERWIVGRGRGRRRGCGWRDVAWRRRRGARRQRRGPRREVHPRCVESSLKERRSSTRLGEATNNPPKTLTREFWSKGTALFWFFGGGRDVIGGAPLGPSEVRVILESCLHASTFLITASSRPDMCLCPSCDSAIRTRRKVSGGMSGSVAFGGASKNKIQKASPQIANKKGGDDRSRSIPRRS
jgi:hypothetical protein